MLNEINFFRFLIHHITFVLNHKQLTILLRKYHSVALSFNHNHVSILLNSQRLWFTSRFRTSELDTQNLNMRC